MRIHRSIFLVTSILCLMTVCGCGDDQTARTAEQQRQQQQQQQQQAIRRVFEIDSALAHPRDQAIAGSISNAPAAIRQYLTAMNGVDFTGVPDDVRQAYQRHLEAWRAGGELLDRYTGLTGTLRAITDGEKEAGAKVEAAEAAIKTTWEAVKQAARAHGVEHGPD